MVRVAYRPVLHRLIKYIGLLLEEPGDRVLGVAAESGKVRLIPAAIHHFWREAAEKAEA